MSPTDSDTVYSYGDVLRRAETCLRAQLSGTVRSVVCRYDEGVLHLKGRLSSYYHKQLAQEAVSKVDGVRRVVNDIVVVSAAG